MALFPSLLLFFLCISKVVSNCSKNDAPEAPVKGKIVFDTTSDPVNEGSKAQLICRGGYGPQDPTLTLTCTSGAWVGGLGTCKAQDCKKAYLEQLVGATGRLLYEPENAEHLSVATYVCADGYEIKTGDVNGEIICDGETCENGYEDVVKNDTFLCHLGTWVGRWTNQCVLPLRGSDISDLTTECLTAAPWSFMHEKSCFVLHKTPQLTPIAAHTACNDLTGYSGHLATVGGDDPEVTALRAFCNTKSVPSATIGLERLDTSGAVTEGWYFKTDKGNWTAEHWSLWWGSLDPKDVPYTCGCVYKDSSGPMRTATCTGVRQYYCQYQSKHRFFVSAGNGEEGTQVLAYFVVADRALCAVECAKCPVCLGFSYKKISGQCQLHPFQSTHANFVSTPSVDAEIFDLQ